MARNVRKSTKSSSVNLPAEERQRVIQRLKSTQITYLSTGSLQPNPRNAKRHPEKQISLLAEHIRRYGFTQPILVDENEMVLAGHGRLEAAKSLGLDLVPVIRLANLSPHEKKLVAIADNKIAELGGFDEALLAAELQELSDVSLDFDLDISLTGFDTVEIDRILGDEPNPRKTDPADDLPVPDPGLPQVTRACDLWLLGRHRLLCGDALSSSSYRMLLCDEQAQMVFTDPPFNVPIAGHVSKRQNVREFVMASGEMTSDDFTAFLRTVTGHIADHLTAGAVTYMCMDWQHLEELHAATRHIFGKPKNLAVWVKSNGGMGSFYRSQHELVAIFVMPGAAPVNNFGLGARGRYRTNVWQYPGVNSLGSRRDAVLEMHPTVKPTAMVADAIKDCSHRNNLVLDCFGGSGTTLIAAEKTGRRARLIEIDPLYCDVIVRRFERYTGEQARHAETGLTFAEMLANGPVVEGAAK